MHSLYAKFASKANTAHIYDLLRFCKYPTSESLLQYFIIIRAIANRIAQDDASLMLYLITGISYTLQNKSMLYCALNVAEFKSKLHIYVEVQTDVSILTPVPKHTCTLPPKLRNFHKSAFMCISFLV